MTGKVRSVFDGLDLDNWAGAARGNKWTGAITYHSGSSQLVGDDDLGGELASFRDIGHRLLGGCCQPYTGAKNWLDREGDLSIAQTRDEDPREQCVGERRKRESLVSFVR